MGGLPSRNAMRRWCAAGMWKGWRSARITGWWRTPRFLVVARRLADGSARLAPKRRASKSDFSDADMDAWIPMNVGEREVTDKKVRRAVRDAKPGAECGRRAPDRG